MAWNRPSSLALGLVLIAGVACAPTTDVRPSTSDVTGARPPAAAATLGPVERTAWEAWLLMELGRLRLGVYGTEALVDLDLPRGVRWTVVEYGPDDYALAVTSDGGEPGLRVDPSGVHDVR